MRVSTRSSYVRRKRGVFVRSLITLVVASSAILAIVSLPGAAGAVPDSQKWEPSSYDTNPNDYPVRVATPADSGLERNRFGDVGVAWWWLKDPKNPQKMIFVLEAEPFWGGRAIGKGGPFVWAVGELSYHKAPQFPLANGILSLKNGLPVGPGATDWAVADGKPGLRSRSLSFNHFPETNSWHVRARGALSGADFTATKPVAGPHGLIKVGGDPATDSLMDEIVLNSRLSGWVNLAGRKIDVTGWRGGYWRMRIVGSAYESLLGNRSWGGWEYSPVMEPDGGGSQFYGILNHEGRYSGPLVNARPHGTRICSKTTLEFGEYRRGRNIFPVPITPPFVLHTIPSWVKVKCAPGQKVQMGKTFYPESLDYGSAGLLDGTEMPVHTVPGSFGTYEHFRWGSYKLNPKSQGR